MNFEGVRKLAAKIRELGLSSTTLALPSPNLALLPAPNKQELTDDFIFEKLINEPEIYDVSRDLFVGQFYNNAVQEAFTALDNYIRNRVGRHTKSGAALMREVFSKGSPLLEFSSLNTQSEMDEQEGYGHIYAGSMLGIRNPTTHEHQWIDNRETALECLIFCQHLLRKAKSASRSVSTSQ